MPINNDQELVEAVTLASTLVQDVQNYCNRKLRDDSKIKFPRGLIGTADSYRRKCPEYLTPDQISSCAYGFMYLDTLWWLASRTDIASVGKQMILKSAIVTLGTLVEATLWIPDLPRDQTLSKKSGAGVITRLKSAAELGWISEKERECLVQLWEHRNNVHIKFLENSERDIYNSEHVNAPYAALLTLMSKQRDWHETRPVDEKKG